MNLKSPLKSVYNIKNSYKEKFNAYNALVEGCCVCQGYSLAYKYLIDKLNKDFNCEIITSKVNNHAWNMVTLDGKKYYVDVTWDDPTNSYEFFCRHKNPYGINRKF